MLVRIIMKSETGYAVNGWVRVPDTASEWAIMSAINDMLSKCIGKYRPMYAVNDDTGAVLIDYSKLDRIEL